MRKSKSIDSISSIETFITQIAKYCLRVYWLFFICCFENFFSQIKFLINRVRQSQNNIFVFFDKIYIRKNCDNRITFDYWFTKWNAIKDYESMFFFNLHIQFFWKIVFDVLKKQFFECLISFLFYFVARSFDILIITFFFRNTIFYRFKTQMSWFFTQKKKDWFDS